MGSLRGKGRTRKLKSDINVVPYIDVMLVLLIIFMVTAPLITPGTIELPSVGQAAEVPVKPLEVQISADGSLALRMREAGASPESVGRDELVSQVKSRITADTPVVIAADGKVPYESVMKVMDDLRTNGITRLGLLVNQGGASNASGGGSNPSDGRPPKRTQTSRAAVKR
jgi:biopolymer transport protein TolR